MKAGDGAQHRGLAAAARAQQADDAAGRDAHGQAAHDGPFVVAAFDIVERQYLVRHKSNGQD